MYVRTVVRDVRWVKVDRQPADNYTLFYGNANGNHHLGTGFSYVGEW